MKIKLSGSIYEKNNDLPYAPADSVLVLLLRWLCILVSHGKYVYLMMAIHSLDCKYPCNSDLKWSQKQMRWHLYRFKLKIFWLLESAVSSPVIGSSIYFLAQ